MNKLIISLLILSLVVLSGCKGIEEITSPEIPVVEILDDCPDQLEECREQLEEVEGFGYEFECDEWKTTDKTLYEDTGICYMWVLWSDGNWYSADYDNVEEYIEAEARNKKLRKEGYSAINQYEDCIQEPYQEEVCVHKKVVGLKR